jgi:hypothetical protein
MNENDFPFIPDREARIQYLNNDKTEQIKIHPQCVDIRATFQNHRGKNPILPRHIAYKTYLILIKYFLWRYTIGQIINYRQAD